jgi:hypothetical protein
VVLGRVGLGSARPGRELVLRRVPRALRCRVLVQPGLRVQPLRLPRRLPLRVTVAPAGALRAMAGTPDSLCLDEKRETPFLAIRSRKTRIATG